MLTESTGNLQKIVETDVALAALDAADVGRMQACKLGQPFLCKLTRKPQLPDPLAESFPIFFPHQWGVGDLDRL